MTNITYELIGERLKIAREKSGLTQKQAAQYLDCQRNYISYIETGSRPVDMISLSKLAELYGYSLDHFVEEEVIEEQPNLEQELYMAFRRNDFLSANDLKTVAWLKRFATNLNLLNNILEEGPLE